MKSKPNTLRKWLTIAGIVLFSAIFLYAGYHLVSYWYAQRESRQLVEGLMETAVTAEAKSDQAPISVDFQALWQENQDVVAWIYSENTPIHYPVVQSQDNSYYLKRLLDGSANANGTIFLDCRCSADFHDFNSILYGHHMKSGEMFGTLPNYKDQAYYDEHPILYLLTPDQNYKVELVAGYVTPSDSDTYTAPQTAEEKREFLATAAQASTFTSGVTAKETDRFITLSTCSYEYNNARYVVVGKLTEIE